MPIELVCGACGREMKVKDDLAGKKVKCPECQAVIRIPAPATAEKAPPRVRAPRDRPPAGKRRDAPPPEQDGGEEEEPRLLRYQQRKKGIPAEIVIPIVLIIVCAIGYPLIQKGRQGGVLKEADASYEAARARLRDDEGEKAAQLMKRAVESLEQVATEPAVMFKHKSFWAQTLLESATPNRTHANRILDECAALAVSAEAKARVSHLRAMGVNNRADHEQVGGFYRASLETSARKEVAAEALAYYQGILDEKVRAIDAKRWEIGETLRIIETATNQTLVAANEKNLAGLELMVEAAQRDFEKVYEGAQVILKLAAEVDSTAVANHSSKFARARQRALEAPAEPEEAEEPRDE